MSQPLGSDEPARDAHLLAALRHAPDRDVAPSATLTATILDQAQRALRPPQAAWPRWHRALRGGFAKLWQPAPMAAFGTLAMATLVGVMWGTGQPPETVPSLHAERAQAAPTAPTVSNNAVGTSSATTIAQSLPAAAETPGPPAAAGEAPRAKRLAPAPTPELARAVGALATAPPVSTGDGARTAPTASVQNEVLAKSLADAAPAPTRARSEIALPALPAPASAGLSPLAPASMAIDSAIERDATRVRWRVSPLRGVAHDTAQREWWSALARGTQGRWQPAATAVASGAESPPLTLLIDGAVQGSVSFEPQAVVWTDSGGRAWRAPVAASTLRAWQEAVSRW